jgi:acyl carrier protein
MVDLRVAQAIADAFGLTPDEITTGSAPENIESWDSVGHLKLILHLEDVFQARFPTNQIPTLTTVGRIQDALQKMNALT